ncbi:alpha-D-ribose 1-methylphosphonate 5-triphosphate diphosphatase [Mesobacterium pallidum]|uniref:alpha-D-ribose 1-methylphosphonate 5-triphosphate diphosphatase n=1 Tax=Mesobacterium pallidum TaxID=2872037 RepID=UPI001EE2D026|nr:alpha-D-ribose 1-methylphosphonate 5-triphosphate diphosphatase [Mesobacterium pallidum]
MRPLRLVGAQVWRDGRLEVGEVSVAEGLIVEGGGATIDLTGFAVLPGIVDVHGDAFERHVAPRRGAVTDMGAGLMGVEAELAANGITTAVLAQFWSWEGGMRSPDFARRLLRALQDYRSLGTDLRVQLRIETHMMDDFAEIEAEIARFGIGYAVFNDHLPHDRLAAGRKPPRLTGQALKSGRSPEAHLALMQALHTRSAEVPEAVSALAARLAAQGVRLGSHDDDTAAMRADWAARGCAISEFPETMEAAQAARDGEAMTIMGAPNVMRGASHAGKVSAREVIAAGLCDALASDYHYPAPLRAVMVLPGGLAANWHLVSTGPARLLGLADRGRIAPGLRADLVVLDPGTGRVGATLADGRITCLSGIAADRFLSAAA